ncbi:sigma-70 family RNA polymerase sigma factor [Verrucomicrobiaceae bacterium N1E253]|uniref:Sigma-70 family RNA polymerase sigma factor n=1 Tax=Oceaniferula marina TaxID=2748318 RepID=A0A851GCC1_9BACT|nr:sigma-70 family RNA polymerase sigma factor [Oceaniferula marina]NWK55076.1 sigma-70 family RNA polymerase sigma factor [Oceaniferula marina]
MESPPKELHEFVKLMIQHQDALRAFIVSLMPGSDDVEDVLQDTNVVIWEKMNSYRAGSDFQAWAFAIARNKAKAQFQSNRRNLSPKLNEKVIKAVCDIWYEHTPQSTVQRQRALDRCVESLKPADQELIRARYNKGDNLEQHAKRTGRSANGLRVELFRVRDKLRKCVNKRLTTEGASP